MFTLGTETEQAEEGKGPMGKGFWMLGLAALVLAGCSSRKAEEVSYAQQALVGMPVQTLLSCAGVPDRREQTDTAEFLTYQTVAGRGGGGSSVGVGVGGGGGNLGLGVSLGFPLTGGSPDQCVATFTVENQRVTRLVYRRDADDAAACYAIVENCLGLIPGRN